MNVRSTAAIIVAALLPAAMLFGSFPYGGLGLPQQVHSGPAANSCNAFAAAAAGGSAYAPTVVQAGFRPWVPPLPGPAAQAALMQQACHQHMQFLDHQQHQTAQAPPLASSPLEDRTNAAAADADGPPPKKSRRGRKSSGEEDQHRQLVKVLAKGVIQDSEFCSMYKYCAAKFSESLRGSVHRLLQKDPALVKVM